MSNIVVIGAGPAGLTAAYELSKNKKYKAPIKISVRGTTVQYNLVITFLSFKTSISKIILPTIAKTKKTKDT